LIADTHISNMNKYLRSTIIGAVTRSVKPEGTRSQFGRHRRIAQPKLEGSKAWPCRPFCHGTPEQLIARLEDHLHLHAGVHNKMTCLMDRIVHQVCADKIDELAEAARVDVPARVSATQAD